MNERTSKNVVISAAVAMTLAGGGVGCAGDRTVPVTPRVADQQEANASAQRTVPLTPHGARDLTFGSEGETVVVTWPASETWELASITIGLSDDPAPAGAFSIATNSIGLAINGLLPGMFRLHFRRMGDGAGFVLDLSRPAEWIDVDHGYPPGTRYGVVRV